MLNTLPPIHFPITSQQISALMDGVQQLNTIDAGLDHLQQKTLDNVLHVYELLADTHGKLDYRGEEGQRRLYQEAVTFVPEALITKHGDLRAAHLVINYNNAQAKLKKHGFPLLTTSKDELINMGRYLVALPLRTDERISLYLNYLAKKT